MVRVTHPFHPWSGEQFVFVALRRTWGEDRVYFYGVHGTVCSLPAGWTDAVPADVFVTVADGRCALRVDDLVALGDLLEDIRGGLADEV